MNSQSRPPQRRRLPREKRRQLLLEAGEQLAQEVVAAGEMNPLLQLTPSLVAERAAQIAQEQGLDAGMSKSMLYYLWGDGMDGYRRELALLLCSQGVDPEGLLAELEPHLDEGLNEVVRLGANWEYERLAPGGRDHPSVLLYAGMLALALDESTLDVVRERAAVDLDTYGAIYEGLLTEQGRVIDEEIGWRGLASALSAMSQGFAQESVVDPELGRTFDTSGSEWTLFAKAAVAVIDAFTRQGGAS